MRRRRSRQLDAERGDRAHDAQGAVEAGRSRPEQRALVGAHHDDVATAVTGASGGAEQHAEAEVVERDEAVEVDGDRAPGVLLHQAGERVAQLGHGGQIDLAGERQHDDLADLAGREAQLHRRDATGHDRGPVRGRLATLSPMKKRIILLLAVIGLVAIAARKLSDA